MECPRCGCQHFIKISGPVKTKRLVRDISKEVPNSPKVYVSEEVMVEKKRCRHCGTPKSYVYPIPLQKSPE